MQLVGFLERGRGSWLCKTDIVDAITMTSTWGQVDWGIPLLHQTSIWQLLKNIWLAFTGCVLDSQTQLQNCENKLNAAETAWASINIDNGI